MTKSQNKKTAFFDLGNVVVLFSHQKMCSQLSALSGIKEEQIQELLLSSQIADNYERGLISSEDLFELFNKRSSTKISLQAFLKSISDIFTINHEIVPLLETLKNNNVELIILSNTCPAHIDFIQRKFSILKLFDAHIFSYELGFRKPEKEIFYAALKKSSSEISNCFYTDDIEEYIATASAIGIDSHHYISLEKLKHALQSKGFI